MLWSYLRTQPGKQRRLGDDRVAGPAQVGYYSVASQISDTLAILPQSIAVVLFAIMLVYIVFHLRRMLREER